MSLISYFVCRARDLLKAPRAVLSVAQLRSKWSHMVPKVKGPTSLRYRVCICVLCLIAEPVAEILQSYLE